MSWSSCFRSRFGLGAKFGSQHGNHVWWFGFQCGSMVCRVDRISQSCLSAFVVASFLSDSAAVQLTCIDWSGLKLVQSVFVLIKFCFCCSQKYPYFQQCSNLIFSSAATLFSAVQRPYFQQCSNLIFSSAATLFSAVQQPYFQQCS